MLHTNHSFLAGGGEMGALMRAHDWRDSPLGPPDAWPSTLKTLLRVLLSSNHPMFIWWGDDLIQFYNDGYRHTLGPERHPAALGQPGRPCWEEAWDLIGPDIESVMRDGASAWFEDRLVPLTRNGRREDVWWTYGYSPIEDEAGIRGVLVICNDVTEDHLLRQRLQQTNHALIETMDDGFCLLELIDDADGRAVDYRFIEANRAFARHTGLVDSVGKTARQLVPNLEQGWVDTYDEIARSGEARRFEEGSEAMGRWFNVYASPIDHPDKRRVALLFTDITDKKNAERALQASETAARAAASQAEADRRRLDALLSSAPVGIVYVDEHGALSAVNRMNRQLWGEHPMSTSQVQYAEWRGWWADGSERHGRPIQAHEWALARALRGERVEVDIVEIAPFGRPQERRTLLTHATAIRAEDGAITGAVAASMDLTDQVDTQRALRESEEKFRTITDAMPQMVWSSRPDGQNDYTNRRWSDFTGLPTQELAGTSWTEAIHPDDLPLLLALWADSLASGALFEIEHRLRHHSGEYRWVLNRALPVRDEAGRIIRWMGTVTDMHDHKLAAEELKAANSRKDEFLAMLAHELRNPLAPISTAAQMLKLSGADPKRIAHASDVIGRQVRHMVELVDDLLDVSRVTRGLVELERQAVDLKSVIQNAIEQARPLIEKKGHTLSTRLGAANVTVTGDRKRLVQVMANLINNAAKYTPDGGEIAVCADPLPDAGQVKLSVKDNGIGIDSALLHDVFELFTQAKRTPDRAQGGLGLGLALVRSMVNLHGGTVEAHSDGPGRGSCFNVVLPLGAHGEDGGTGQREGDSTLAAQSRLRILIVDDNRDAAESLGIVLSAVGHEVGVEDSSMAALRRVDTESFDVCLLDIGLPDLDGHRLVERLRAAPLVAGAAMIALSGYGQPQDMAASKQAGFTRHLVKPVDIGNLLALLDGVAPRAPG
ncbi:PAS domain S-box protein [Massilia sp. CFBP9012]|uniref:hybrid sensor histidine kinase/response regulator n=1 Tax=Massilia sp. CFBP9012 TaxID=3096531 RepID=UPI002A6B8438|nr:PAS domain S-box protein [Massilia sp. CFBP9012]MDY0973867.1 PAS domain S-box protein [Massilia sp. CFBP9012]